MSDNGPVLGIILSMATFCTLVGSCVHDYATAKPQAHPALILEKSYTPGHYHTDCSSHKGHTSCSTHWVPPSWSICYSDEQRHWVSVSSGTYEALHIGDTRIVYFDLGGGPWHARYGERFSLGPVKPEQDWPAR
jgi:hypothetical protein